MEAKPPVADAEPEPTHASLKGGLRIGLGLAGGSFLLAVAFGALARTGGWSVGVAIAGSALIFSGSAQFTLASVLAAGGGIVPAIAAAALINVRFVPMALAAGPSLQGGRLRRALEGQAVVDGSWAAAHKGAGQFDRDLLQGATLPQWPAWVLGTALGVFVAPPTRVAASLGLDVVFPAFFALLLVSELRRSHAARVAAAGSAGLAMLCCRFLPPGVAVLAALFAVVLAARVKC